MSRRQLPIAARSAPALADSVRVADRVRPIYAVWELTLRCDLGSWGRSVRRAMRS
jgi:hypothetical protein